MSGPTLVILAAGRARRYGGLKQLAPIGRHGEGVIDLIASDAMTAGFEDIVIVVNHDTGPTIQEHVAQHWPKEHRVSFAFQEKMRGTVDAVLAAEEFVDHDRPFGVSNADDLYGLDALMKLGGHLSTSSDCCMVAFQLENSLIGDLPVSRGTCEVTNGRLTHVEERRNVHFTPDGLEADDGLLPRFLSPEALVSMNLWGFQPTIWPLIHREVREHDFQTSAEVLLPTFVARVMARENLVFAVLETSSRCIGVTHAEDLPLAQFLVREDIKSGLRPEFAFS